MSDQKKESLVQGTENQDHDRLPPKYSDHSDIPNPGENEPGKYGTTQRGLKSRHIQLIALGGCIGTGLFVGTGATLSLVGPAPLFMGIVLLSTLHAKARKLLITSGRLSCHICNRMDRHAVISRNGGLRTFFTIRREA